jgi:chorismate mutase/prephenate dehydratase
MGQVETADSGGIMAGKKKSSKQTTKKNGKQDAKKELIKGPGASQKQASSTGQHAGNVSRYGKGGSAGGRTVSLEDARVRINAIDADLVRLLNERASMVVEVGKRKRAAGLPVYTPHREVEVIERVLKASHACGGVLPDKAIEAIYRELMSGSIALQQPMRVGYLGPPGSYSHQAAVKHFGSSVEFDDLHAIEGVFTEVARGHVNCGLVPIENSLHGGVMEALDAFREKRRDLTICAEVQMEVHHALLANCPPASVKRIHSKPEVFSQCRGWLATQYPKAELVAEASSSRAAVLVADESKREVEAGRVPEVAAIAGELAGQLYGLNVLFQRIEDHPNNLTRFLVISKNAAGQTGHDKTSIMFDTADKPGALVSVLSVFERHRVNLSHIDKRPSGKTNWSYTFFIDAAGHQEDRVLAAAVIEARTHCKDLVVLGSYPISKRVL